MRSRTRRPSHSSHLPVVLCALIALLMAGAPAVGAPDEPGDEPVDEPSASVAVQRLYAQAATATQRYEEGRRAAEGQRAKARRLEWLVERERRQLRLLHDDLGRIARAQYRSGGDVSYTAQLLMADDPEQLMRSQRAAWQADLAMDNAISKTQRSARALDGGEQRAQAAWRGLDARKAQLAELKRGIEQKLEEARWTLQNDADRQVTAGKCRGAVRLDQPEQDTERDAGREWVAPVETYELSAGFGGSGERWANRHTGQDFAVGIGAPVRAAGAGKVVRVTCGQGFGMEVVVGHEGGYYTQYAHLAAVTVDQGERVRAGQWLGQAGTTGNSTGPHLHFEVRLTPQYGSGVDPRKWLAERGVQL
ncbi:M23 family metallopeptidase [Streptomyces boluensis]|uniref:Peptidoglycan DD-metalloendopeptidase family protein n=1 Tax=Streptomyces boluensis TaxID=1775135 RepID=A0A964XNW1_9ACTN|nr:M23 family metallopeptidase [Streptomyces boluensis]NBE55915.1 peptidoglycan DD-metalloendopeptidase family protein [Streptomyces boluensis]